MCSTARLTLFVLSDKNDGNDPDGSAAVSAPGTTETFLKSLALDPQLDGAIETGLFQPVNVTRSTDGWLFELLHLLGLYHPECQNARARKADHARICASRHAMIAERTSIP